MDVCRPSIKVRFNLYSSCTGANRRAFSTKIATNRWCWCPSVALYDNFRISLGGWIFRNVGVEKLSDHLTVRGQMSFQKGLAWTSNSVYDTESRKGGLLHEKLKYPQSCTLVKAIRVTPHLEGWKQAQNSYWIESFKLYDLNWTLSRFTILVMCLAT